MASFPVLNLSLYLLCKLITFMLCCFSENNYNMNNKTRVFTANCGANMVYNQYITDSQPSCKERDPAPRTGLPPSYGCVCKDGFVLDNAAETCLDEKHCGCPTEDNYYSVSTVTF